MTGASGAPPTRPSPSTYSRWNSGSSVDYGELERHLFPPAPATTAADDDEDEDEEEYEEEGDEETEELEGDGSGDTEILSDNEEE